MRLNFSFKWKHRIIGYATVGVGYLFLAWISIIAVATRTDFPSMILWFWIQQLSVFIAGLEFGFLAIELWHKDLFQSTEGPAK